MTIQELPPRQKSQRLMKRNQQRDNQLKFEQFKNKSKTINNINELLPGLNDISDAFEALPVDIIKYFTLLKEIDAKCINTVPVINNNIKEYIETLHEEHDLQRQMPSKVKDISSEDIKAKKLIKIRDKINDIIPCLEEKMHVTSIATDVIDKHLFRINNDYKLILNNNEIPESIRIGPLNHPAMIMDSSAPSDMSNPNRSAQSSRLETRREALAARKQNKDDDNVPVNGVRKEQTPVEKKKRSRKDPPVNANNNNSNNNVNSSNTNTGNNNHASNNSNNNNHGAGNVNAGGYGNNSVNSNNSHNSNNNSNSTNTHNNHNTQHNSTGPINTSDSHSRQGTPGPRKKLKTKDENTSNEPTYCYCNQISFGEMVGCDGDDCKREWFHLPCIGFKNPPKGKWYCDDCLIKQKKIKRV